MLQDIETHDSCLCKSKYDGENNVGVLLCFEPAIVANKINQTTC